MFLFCWICAIFCQERPHFQSKIAEIRFLPWGLCPLDPPTGALPPVPSLGGPPAPVTNVEPPFWSPWSGPVLGTDSVWELEDIHTNCRNILLIFMRNFFLSVVYIALSNEIVFGFTALYCMSFWLCFLCLLFELNWVSLVFRPTRHKTGHFGDVYYLMCVCRS